MDSRIQEQWGASAARSHNLRPPSASAAGKTKSFVVKPPFLKPVFPITHSLELALHCGWLVSPPLDCVVDHSAPRRLGKGPLTERC